MKLFINDLTVVDAAYLDAERGFVGESYQVDIILQGSLDEQSMILDFSTIKKHIKAIIDAEIDHKLLVPHAADNCSVIIGNQRTQINYKLSNNSFIQLKCPNEAFCLLESEIINKELLETYLKHIILLQLPDNVLGMELTLRNESTNTPYYQYIHGLKKHNGNCQRIAHGHRSKLEIYINDSYHTELVNDWAERWRDTYLLSKEDIVSESDLTFTVLKNEFDKISTAYHAPQGHFELLMPAYLVAVIESDTTVEMLAKYIGETIKTRFPNDKVTVNAYEGIGKGAIIAC